MCLSFIMSKHTVAASTILYTCTHTPCSIPEVFTGSGNRRNKSQKARAARPHVCLTGSHSASSSLRQRTPRCGWRRHSHLRKLRLRSPPRPVIRPRSHLHMSRKLKPVLEWDGRTHTHTHTHGSYLSVQTSSCAPGTPTPPAAHLPTRPITAGKVQRAQPAPWPSPETEREREGKQTSKGRKERKKERKRDRKRDRQAERKWKKKKKKKKKKGKKGKDWTWKFSIIAPVQLWQGSLLFSLISVDFYESAL